MERDDGGPAYPVLELLDEAGNVMVPASQGISTRDYFAGQALIALLGEIMGATRPEHHGLVAVRAYQIADAMLAARKP